MARLALVQLLAIAAVEIAGARDLFAGICALLADMAEVLGVALRTDEETEAKLVEEQNRKRRRLAQERRDVRQTESQLIRPNQLPVVRVMEDRQGDFKASMEKGNRENPFYMSNEQPKKGKGEYGWRPGRRRRFYKGGDSEGGRDYDGRRKKRFGDEGNKDDRRRPRRRTKERQSRGRRSKKGEERDAK